MVAGHARWPCWPSDALKPLRAWAGRGRNSARSRLSVRVVVKVGSHGRAHCPLSREEVSRRKSMICGFVDELQLSRRGCRRRDGYD